MAQVLLAVAAFDVAPADPEQPPHVVPGEPHCAAHRLELLFGHQRVAAVELVGDEECPGRRDLRDRVVVHVHQLGVRLCHFVDGVAAEGAEGVLLVRPLVVVERAVVERLAAAGHELIALHYEVHGRVALARGRGAEIGEAPLGNRGRTEAELGVVA